MTQGYDVFLSYNSADLSVVEMISMLLQGRGLQPWFDKSWKPGDFILEE